MFPPVRRAAVFLAALAFAPAAHAAPPAVTAQATPASGAAPLAVTLTASGRHGDVPLGSRRRQHRGRTGRPAHLRRRPLHRPRDRHQPARRDLAGDGRDHRDGDHPRRPGRGRYQQLARFHGKLVPAVKGARLALYRNGTRIATVRSRPRRELLRPRARRHAGRALHRPLRGRRLERGRAGRAPRARHRLQRLGSARNAALAARPRAPGHGRHREREGLARPQARRRPLLPRPPAPAPAHRLGGRLPRAADAATGSRLPRRQARARADRLRPVARARLGRAERIRARPPAA